MTAVLDNADTVAEAIRPTLDKFVCGVEPSLRKVSEVIYEQLLYSVQDYLRENAEWNIGAEIDRCRKIELDNTQLRASNLELRLAIESVMPILGTAESNASGNPEWDYVGPRIAAVRAAIAKARGQ